MKYCRILFFAILIFLTISPVYSKGQKNHKDDLEYEEEDTSLREIRKLMRETNYDDAFKLLTVYIKQNPDNFDNAQRLIAVIMEAKKKYAETLDKLIVLISTDPDNDEEIYKVIRELKKIEKHPSDSSLTYIDNIDRVVTFSHNQKESRRILTTSSEYVSAGQYLESLNVIQEGFVLYREEYEDTWGKDSNVLNETDSIISDLKAAMELFAAEDFNSRLNDAVSRFENSVHVENYSSANGCFNEIEQLFMELAAYRKRIYEDGQKLDELNKKLSLGDDDLQEENAFFSNTDASYLPFMTHFVYGDSELTDSGIIPTIDKKIISLLLELNGSVYSCINKKYTEYTTFFRDNKSSVAQNESDVVYSSFILDFANLENRVLALEPIIYTSAELESDSSIGQNLQMYSVLGSYVYNLVKESERIFKVNTELNRIASVQENIFESLNSTSDAAQQSKLVSSLLNSTAELGGLVGVKVEQELNNFEWAQLYIQNQYQVYDELSKLYTDYLEKIFNDSSSILNSGWTKIAGYYETKSNEAITLVSEYNNKAKMFNDGFDEKIGKETHSYLVNNIKNAFQYSQNSESLENDDIKYKYPDITQLMTVYSYKEFDSAITEIGNYKTIITENYDSHEQWKLDEGISSLVLRTTEHFDQLVAQLKTLQKENLDLRNLCKKQISASELLKSDAEYDLDDAEAEIKRENFDVARSKIKTSSEKLVRALDIQSDEAYSEVCDERIRELGMQITRMENEKVVREVRELKTLAKNAYVDGRFDDAEKYLSKASSRWSVTNSEEDAEIVNLQVFVNTAMSTKTGREILPSAPQYEEMTQLLTLAYRYYDDGRSALNKGNKTVSNENFDNADDCIKKLKLVYPIHREASLLSLRINKLRNPTEFQRVMQVEIEKAFMDCSSSDKEKQKQGYADLQDYYEIDPNYKGLKNKLDQAEIKLGLKVVVDNSGAKKAKAIYDEANRLFRAGNLEAAKNKIDESLTLNDEDKAAQNLKDRIVVAIGGTKIPLSTDAQKLYSKSYDYFVQNNLDMAEVYLNRLAKLDSRFMNDDDVQRLKAKIEALK